MTMKFLCNFKPHRWLHIANFDDITGGRGLYQCARCSKVIMDRSSNNIKKPNFKKVGNNIEYNLFY
jgi:hypothetical protein